MGEKLAGVSGECLGGDDDIEEQDGGWPHATGDSDRPRRCPWSGDVLRSDCPCRRSVTVVLNRSLLESGPNVHHCETLSGRSLRAGVDAKVPRDLI